jgi:hypothetical protein
LQHDAKADEQALPGRFTQIQFVSPTFADNLQAIRTAMKVVFIEMPLKICL